MLTLIQLSLDVGCSQPCVTPARATYELVVWFCCRSRFARPFFIIIYFLSQSFSISRCLLMRKPQCSKILKDFWAISLQASLSFLRVTACLPCRELSFCSHDDCWVPQSVLPATSIIVFKNLLIGNLSDPNGSLKGIFLNSLLLNSLFYFFKLYGVYNRLDFWDLTKGGKKWVV